MFTVSLACLQTFIDMPNCDLKDHVQQGRVNILNIFCDGCLQIINCVGIVRQVHRDYLIILYKTVVIYMKYEWLLAMENLHIYLNI
jgi:hypothetical protein